MASGELALILLAAGEGTRMRSRLPKVLHPVCGRPILLHAVRLGREIGAKRIVVVVGRGEDQLRDALAGEEVELVRQERQLGTGHAALQAAELLGDHAGPILVTNGDHPLYRPQTFAALLDAYRAESADLALLTAHSPEPEGYGRVVRDSDGKPERIVEETEAQNEIRATSEVNLGAYVAEAELLFPSLAQIGNKNRKGEFYLTDLLELVAESGRRVASFAVEDWNEALGVNTRADLAKAEAAMRERIAERWLREGVTLIDPGGTYIEIDVEIGADTVISPGTMLRGATRVGSGCRIDAGSVIEDSTLGDGVWIKSHCSIEQSEIGNDCEVGPSAHLRPDSHLSDGVRIGNFVEIKNSRLGRGTKADHLSYIGDATVGSGVTIGCGAITVNYDGREKYRTTIGDGAFVGCNANLIAPVEVAAEAYVAAGSTITDQVPEGSLAVARARQRNIEGWRKRRFGSSQD